jgi:hypothetical protein
MKCFDRFLSASGILLRRSIASAVIALIALAALTSSAPAQETITPTGTPQNIQSSTAGTGTQPSASGLRTPARKPFRAARLTYIEGDVRVEQANSTENSVAVVNMPLVEGTVISSGPDGQAEIEFEDGSVARLTPNSGLSLLNLSVDSSGSYQTRIALLGGLAYFELRAGTKYIYTVDAGGDVFSPVENATVRINFDEPPAVIAVLDGTAHLAAAGGSYTDATAGQTVRTDPASEGGVYMVKQTIAPETWDRWNEDRDEVAANEADSQTDARTNYAGNQGYGWSDLDANGSWYDVPGHGEVWQPDLAAAPADEAADGDQTSADNSGFDPYGYGSWAYTPAGYAWASGYGWGWLPYRCGLWSYYPGFGWGWSPNSFCGVYGFAGYGYGYGLNFGTLPGGYRRPHRPIPGPGPIHPILRGHGGPVPVAPVHRLGGDRMIAGNTVQPLPPVGSGFAQRGGSSLGAALRRDYPVDAKTHAPVMGLVAATPGAPAVRSNARAAWQPVGQSNGQSRGSYSPLRPSPAQIYEDGNRSAPVNRPAPVQRQTAPSAPRSSPPAPASHSAPASSSSSSKGK